MPFSEQFLSRVEQSALPQLELALSLHHDPARVQRILARARVPEGVERVALSLAHPTRGPFLLVARDGTVTRCLEAGDSPSPFPVLTRAQLDAGPLGLDVASSGAAPSARGPARKSGAAALFERIYSAGEFLGREELSSFMLWQPLLRRELSALYLDEAIAVEKLRDVLLRREKPHPSSARAYTQLWLGAWATAHLLGLLACDGRDDLAWMQRQPATERRLTWWLFGHGVQCFALRATWAVGRLATALFPTQRANFHEAASSWELAESTMALVAVATTHEPLRDEVLKLFHQVEDPGETDDGSLPALLRRLRYGLAQTAIEALQADPSELRAEVVAIGRREHHGIALTLDPGKPFRYATPDEVPEDLAFAALFDSRRELLKDQRKLNEAVRLVPVIARLSLEELYYPRAYHAQWPRGLTPDYVERHLLCARRFPRPAAPPAKAAPATGRNAPCPCGSGKKHKLCCGR